MLLLHFLGVESRIELFMEYQGLADFAQALSFPSVLVSLIYDYCRGQRWLAELRQRTVRRDWTLCLSDPLHALDLRHVAPCALPASLDSLLPYPKGPTYIVHTAPWRCGSRWPSEISARWPIAIVLDVRSTHPAETVSLRLESGNCETWSSPPSRCLDFGPRGYHTKDSFGTISASCSACLHRHPSRSDETEPLHLLATCIILADRREFYRLIKAAGVISLAGRRFVLIGCSGAYLLDEASQLKCVNAMRKEDRLFVKCEGLHPRKWRY